MKTTGIVRGIDSLGRIVLPKELRTNMHIDKDSKLEIFVEGDQIILKKHRPAGSRGGRSDHPQKAPSRRQLRFLRRAGGRHGPV